MNLSLVITWHSLSYHLGNHCHMTLTTIISSPWHSSPWQPVLSLWQPLSHHLGNHYHITLGLSHHLGNHCFITLATILSSPWQPLSYHFGNHCLITLVFIVLALFLAKDQCLTYQCYLFMYLFIFSQY